MATLLLLVIYIAFIGLGLPDSLFGAAWPAICPEFGMEISSASFVTVAVSGNTVLSSMLSARLIARFSTQTITAVSTAMTAVALLGYAVAPNIWCMCLFAVVLGLGAGAIDAALNHYISLHYSAMHMNFLHCFYGVGVVVSPYIMSRMLESATWREGYRTVFLIQLGIALILLCSFPLWKRVRHKNAQARPEMPQKVLSLPAMASMPKVRLAWVLCVATNAIEASCGVWGSTFLVFSHDFSPAAAAGAIVFFYLGMALGRFLSGVLSAKLSPWRLIFLGTAIVCGAAVLLFIPDPLVAIAGLFLAGLGNGPIYPNLMYLVPENFGEEISASVIGSQMAFAYGGFMAAPPLLGILVQAVSAEVFPAYILFWFAVMVLFLWRFAACLRRKVYALLYKSSETDLCVTGRFYVFSPRDGELL